MSINMRSQISNPHDDLWLLLDNIRSSGLLIDEVLVWLVSLSVIAKETPNNFHGLCDLKSENQKEFFFNNIKKSEFLEKYDLSHRLIPAEQFISSDSLAKLITYIKNVTDFNEFADELIYAFQKTASRGLELSITDQVIVEIIKGIIGDVSQLKIYDGAAGLCSLTSQLNTKKLVLEDINSRALAIGKCILFLKDIDAEYTLANSLTSLKKSVHADLVVTQASWGVRFAPKDIEKIKESKYIQLKDKMEIPTSASDSLWIQHSIYNLNDNGRAILLMPQGWLFRGGYDAELRVFLLESDLIETVIALPPSLLKSKNIPTVLLIFNKNKANKNIVHFIDASQLGVNIKRHKELDRDEIQLIADLVKGYHPAHHCYRAISLSEIKENNYELSINSYLNYPINLKVNDLKSERNKLELALRKFNEAQEKIMKLIMENT